MLKIFLASTDNVFSEKINKILSDDSNLTFGNTESEHNKVNEALAGKADLVVLDFHDIHFLRDTLPKAAVIIASDTYDLKKEYLSARFGAKGFITKNTKPHSFKKAIEAVKSGQLWMTRFVVTLVFEQYRRILKER